MDIISGIERTVTILVNALEPLLDQDVLGGLIIVLVLLVVLGKAD